MDSDEFLAPREELVRSLLRHGGRVVLRNVTFHFDDTTEEDLRLWERQDRLMRGDFGVFGDLQPEVLENPARLIRGKNLDTIVDITILLGFFQNRDDSHNSSN